MKGFYENKNNFTDNGQQVWFKTGDLGIFSNEEVFITLLRSNYGEMQLSDKLIYSYKNNEPDELKIQLNDKKSINSISKVHQYNSQKKSV